MRVQLRAKRLPLRERHRKPLRWEPDHRAHTDRYEGPETASIGNTSAPQAGQ
jgi:hypothetical protein